MPRVNFDQLLDAGVHFGHLKRKWNPSMAPYIFMERNDIHVIDLYKTQAKLEEAADAMRQIAKSGKKILFVATKKQAQDIVQEKAKAVGMPFMTERWPGGLLTNFATIRKAVKKMSYIDKLMKNPATLKNIAKRERLQITREREKLEKQLGGIADLNRLPSALFVVDINKEHIAIKEARKLNIPTFAMVDTNSDPTLVDFPIPANDDASKSIALILDVVVKATEEGLMERKAERAEKDEKIRKDKEAKKQEKQLAEAKKAEEKKAEAKKAEEEKAEVKTEEVKKTDSEKE
ncbi:MAG: 30S ribosomal protein S2 [Bacteroidota bacterium]|nr:30S ribosomal protein S2 [Bacteroidota bacterium]